MLTVVTWLWGDRYKAEHVNSLARQVARHYRRPHRFLVVTNRIASPWQRVQEGVVAGDNINRHREIGEIRRTRYRTLLDITCTKGFGGVVTVVSKAAWQESGGYADGLFCIDHSLFFRTKAAGRRVFLMEGLYVYHLRATSGAPGKQEPKWAECPCRGREEMPTERIQL